MYLIAEGAHALQILEGAFTDAGLKLQLDHKLKNITTGEFNTYGAVELRIKLFRVAFPMDSAWVLQVRTARPKGHLTNPGKIYEIHFNRTAAGLVQGFRT